MPSFRTHMSEKTMTTHEAPHTSEAFKAGLEGVVAGATTITFLDGLKGRMIYKGYNALDLAGRVTFEEVVHLLWESDLPNKKQLDSFSKIMVQHRALPADLLE